jgi:hypothetical protein
MARGCADAATTSGAGTIDVLSASTSDGLRLHLRCDIEGADIDCGQQSYQGNKGGCVSVCACAAVEQMQQMVQARPLTSSRATRCARLCCSALLRAEQRTRGGGGGMLP